MSTGQPHGSWFGRLMAHLPAYLASEDKEQRGEFIAEISRKVGQAPNTTWRQLVALQYLANHGVDLNDLADRRPPALASIESVARVGKANKNLEAELLNELVKGRKTVQFYADEARKAREKVGPVPLHALQRIPLSELLVAHLPSPGDFWDARELGRVQIGLGLQIQFPGRGGLKFLARSPMPLIVIDQDGIRGPSFRTAVFAADHSSASAKDADFQLLFEGSVLRSLVICDKVIVCTNFPLPELERTMRIMRNEHLSRLQVIHCHLDVDLKPVLEARRFATLTDCLNS